MPQLNVTLEIVTPLFLGGANPRGEPELRPASFKGELRYWWRALYGGVRPGIAPDALARDENPVFGSTEGASPLVVRISHEPDKKAAWSFGKWQGLDYLFFSVRGRGSDPDRRAFSPQQSFQLTLQPRLGLRGAQQDRAEQGFLEACAALWLAVRLGGVGARARRGAGNLHVTEARGWPNTLPPLAPRARSAAGLNQEMGEDLKRLYQALGWSSPPPSLPVRPEFDVLHPKGGPLYVLGKEWDTWQEALDDVGVAYRDFRSRRQPDYSNVKDVVSGASSQLGPVERAAFGLPIVFYYRSLGGQRGTLDGETATGIILTGARRR